MKKTVFLSALLLVVPAFTAAQTPTRQRRSDDAEALRTGARTVRDRIVGARAANHVEKLKTDIEAPVSVSSDPQQTRSSSSSVNQDSAEPKWGNTAVVIRSGPGETAASTESTQKDKPKVASQRDQPVKKLVQQTSLAPALRTSSGAGNAAVAMPVPVTTAAPTVVYHVGIGDVLDIRLTNLPTRESTLYTVLKNGVLEYPLLNAPLSVAGMTTDEIASLLGNEIKVLKAARVSVSVRDYASHAVVISGLVDSPGRKTMRREAMPLFAVLAEALPRPEASLATLIRDGKSQTLSLNDVPAMSTLVLAGDVIKISGGGTATRFVYVGGDVVSRGEKEFRDGMTLTQAILSAGGAVRGSQISIKVARRDARGFLKSNEYNLQLIEAGKAQDPLLEAGDRIEVTRGM